MTEEKVSVIITTYRGSDTIARAIESVCGQTYKNIEVIVVDDNGLGQAEQIETQKIVESYENVKYLPHEVNRNGAAARNTGIRSATGTYLCFLDDDDYYYPERIEKQTAFMQSLDSSYAFSFCTFTEIFSEQDSRIIKAKGDGNLLFDFLMMRVRIGSSIIMLRKKVVDEVNGFDESFIRHQDWEFICRILANYKAAAFDFNGVGRVILNRNAPCSPEKIEKLRLYYLEKMDPIIKTLSSDQQKNIYTTHYIAIAKEYLCAGQYKKYVEYRKKSKHPIRAWYVAMRSVIYRGLKKL